MRAVVPFGARNPNSRLGPFLSPDERRALATAMLADVLAALLVVDADPEVLADASVDLATDLEAVVAQADLETSGERDYWPAPDPATLDAVPVTVDDRPLDPLVNDALRGAGPDAPVAVVMADLPLATPRTIDHLLRTRGDVVVAPGRGGGTNALVVRHPDFRVDYHGASYLDHLRRAREAGASVREVDSMRLATDVDERADLAEVVLHGRGLTAAWLRGVGIDLALDDGRVGVRRR